MKVLHRLPLPTIHWDLISCSLHGHFLVGTDAKNIRPQDTLFVRESDGLRLYRCLRCSSWVLRTPPKKTTRDTPPDQDEIDLPIRGRLLRDRYVLRLIAVDRAVHVLFFLSVSVLIFLFATHEQDLRVVYDQVLRSFQGLGGGFALNGTLVRLQSVFDFKKSHVIEAGLAVAAYGALEATEMVGLWQGRRWAEYLTFIATLVFIPYEIYELAHGVSVIKVGAFVINLAIVAYLLYAKRLFGVHGGAKGEAAEKREDSGWEYLKRTAPKAAPSK